MKYCVILCSLLIFVAVIGCSQGTKTNVTEFIVTLDNQPLDGANLGLIPQNADGVAAFGRTGADGKCQTQTLFGRANGGTAAGKYKVTVSKLKEQQTGKKVTNPDTGVAEEEIENVESLPPLYVNEQTTPFLVEIKEGKNSFTLELMSKQ